MHKSLLIGVCLLLFIIANCKCENFDKHDKFRRAELKKIHNNTLEHYRLLYGLSCQNRFHITLGYIVINDIKYFNFEVGVYYNKIKNNKKLKNNLSHYVVCIAEPDEKQYVQFKLFFQFDEWLRINELDEIVDKTEQIKIDNFLITKKHLKPHIDILMEDIKESELKK